MKAIPLDSLQLGAELGKGGQGTVRAIDEPHAGRYVYKEYREPRDIDFDVLSSFPDTLASLSPAQQVYVRSRTAWPELVVAAGGRPSGFVMARLRDDFFHLGAASGKRRLRDMQALFNGHEYVRKHYGIDYRPAHPYQVLLDLAGLLTFLHERDIHVGDISPRNIAFRIDPQPEIHLIDCDAMTIGGRTITRAVETPGWEVPARADGRREPLGTDASDTYKFGLIVLRILVGAQEPRTVDSLPFDAPHDIRLLLAQTLADDPGPRPPMSAWPPVLDRHARTAAGWVDRPAAAPVVVVDRRPVSAHRKHTATQTPAAGNPVPQQQRDKDQTLAIAVVIGVICLIVLLTVVATAVGT